MVQSIVLKVLVLVVVAVVAFAVGNFFGAKNVTPFPRLTTITSLPSDLIIYKIRGLASGQLVELNEGIVTIDDQGKTGKFPIDRTTLYQTLSKENPFRYGTPSANLSEVKNGVSTTLILELEGSTFVTKQIVQPAFQR